MHDGQNKVVFCHDLRQFFNALLCVAVDEGLRDVQVGVKVEQKVDFEILFHDWNVVLTDSF